MVVLRVTFSLSLQLLLEMRELLLSELTVVPGEHLLLPFLSVEERGREGGREEREEKRENRERGENGGDKYWRRKERGDTIILENNALSKECEFCDENCTRTHKKSTSLKL